VKTTAVEILTEKYLYDMREQKETLFVVMYIDHTAIYSSLINCLSDITLGKSHKMSI